MDFSKHLTGEFTHTTDSGFKDCIDSIPAGVRELMEVMPERCRTALPRELLAGFKNVVMTGCGDSLCAALVSREAFERFTSLRVDTPACIDLGRHYDLRRMGEKNETLAIIISTSGAVSRCAEAARRAKRGGAVTLAVTANRDAALAKNCDYVLDVTLGEFKGTRAPGSRNYVGSALALQIFAAELGVATGCITCEERDAFMAEMARVNSAWEQALPELNARLSALAPRWAELPYFEALGSGPEFATAWYSQAKIFEAVNLFARYENFEDWCHVDYILRQRNSGVMLFCMSNNPALSRCREVESILDRQQYEYLVFTDADPESFLEPQRVVSLPSCSYNFLSAVFEGIPGCVLFDYVQRIKGNGYYASDMIDSWFPFGGAILRTSDIVEVD